MLSILDVYLSALLCSLLFLHLNLSGDTTSDLFYSWYFLAFLCIEILALTVIVY